MATQTKYQVEEIIWREKNFLTKRATLTFDKLTNFFQTAYVDIYNTIAQQGLTSPEPPFALYYQVDGYETDLAAAVPIHGSAEENEEFQSVTIPESWALKLTCYGSYDHMKPAYETLNSYVNENGFETLLMLEQYFSDPGIEDDPAKWRTDIYYIVR